MTFVKFVTCRSENSGSTNRHFVVVYLLAEHSIDVILTDAGTITDTPFTRVNTLRAEFNQDVQRAVEQGSTDGIHPSLVL